MDAQQQIRLTRRMRVLQQQTRAFGQAHAGLSAQARLQALFEERLAPHAAMGATAILLRGGVPEQTLCFGEAAPGEPVVPQTRFRVASVSKMIAGLGVMQLVEEGKLALDADIGEYLGYAVRNPRFPNAAVTLRQLMTHTSGLTDNGDYLDMGTERALPLSAYFASREHAMKNFYDCAPGVDTGYSNLGAGMTGAIVEKLTGMDFDAWMQKSVFEPLGMDASYHPQRIARKELLANIYEYPTREISYHARALAQRPMEDWADPERHYTTLPGRLVISAPDLARLLRALGGDGSVDGVRLLKEETVREMRAPQAGRGSVGGNTQRGLNIDRATNAFCEGTLCGHQGNAYGAIAEAWFDPETGDGALLQTNGVWVRHIRPYARVGHDVIASLLAAREWL